MWDLVAIRDLQKGDEVRTVIIIVFPHEIGCGHERSHSLLYSLSKWLGHAKS